MFSYFVRPVRSIEVFVKTLPVLVMEMFVKTFLCLVVVTATCLTVEAGGGEPTLEPENDSVEELVLEPAEEPTEESAEESLEESSVVPLVVPRAQPGAGAVPGFTYLENDFFVFQDITGGSKRALVDLKGKYNHDFREDPPFLAPRNGGFHLSIPQGADTVVVDKYNPLTLEIEEVASFSDLEPGKLRNLEAFWLASEGKEYQKYLDFEHHFLLEDSRGIEFDNILLDLEIPADISGKVVDIQAWTEPDGPFGGKVFYLIYNDSNFSFEILSGLIWFEEAIESEGRYMHRYTQERGDLTLEGTFLMTSRPKAFKQVKFAFGPSSSSIQGSRIDVVYSVDGAPNLNFSINQDYYYNGSDFDNGYTRFQGIVVNSRTHEDFFTFKLYTGYRVTPRMMGGVLLDSVNPIDIPMGDDSGNLFDGISKHEISLRILPDGLLKYSIYLQSDLSEVNLNHDNSIDMRDLSAFLSTNDVNDPVSRNKGFDLLIEINQILDGSLQKTIKFKDAPDLDPDDRTILGRDLVVVENPLFSAPSVASKNEDPSLKDISLEKLVILREIVKEVEEKVGSSGFLSNLLSKIDSVLQNPTDVNRLENTIGEIETLLQNYPNPFNPETIIPVQGLKNSEYKLNIFDSSGNNIRTINLNGGANPSQEIHWNGRNNKGEKVSSGVYWYNLEGKDFISTTHKMVIMK